jgi:hypothetical protein
MPLFPSAKDLIRIQLIALAGSNSVRYVDIGYLTADQFKRINQLRVAGDFAPLDQPVLVYKGAHHFKSRVTGDGYSFDDLYAQIDAATHPDATVDMQKHMTTLISPIQRNDGYGFKVRDRAILELTSRKPKAELFSVIPKGDAGGPKKRQGR